MNSIDVNTNSDVVRQTLGDISDSDPYKDDEVIYTLFELMVGTIEIDFAINNVLKNADLKLQEFKNLRATVEKAWKESRRTKKAIVDFLKGIYHLLVKLKGIQAELDFESQDNPQTNKDFNLTQRSKIKDMLEQLKEFETFSCKSSEELQEVSGSLIDASGETAFKERWVEYRKKCENYDKQFKKVKENKNIYGEELGKVGKKKAEIETMKDQIQGSTKLNELLSRELAQISDIKIQIQQKKATAPPSNTSTENKGWLLSSSNRTYDSTRDDLDKNYDAISLEFKDKEQKINKIRQDIEEAKKGLSIFENDLNNLESDAKNAESELNKEERELSRLSNEKENIYNELMERSQKTGQGEQQLLRTYKASRDFIYLIDKRTYNQIFAGQMMSNLAELEKQLEEFDKDQTFERKQRRLAGPIFNGEQFGLLNYLQKAFNDRFRKMTETTSRMSRILEVEPHKMEFRKQKEASTPQRNYKDEVD